MGLNKNLKRYQGHHILMVANSGAEATNKFQRNINDGYDIVTLTTMHKIWGRPSN